MNENKQWPEDRADWPHAVGVVQGGVVPATQQLSAADCYSIKTSGATKAQPRLVELNLQRDMLLDTLQRMVDELEAQYHHQPHKQGVIASLELAKSVIAWVKGSEK